MKSLHLSNLYHLLAIAWLLLFALINSGECATIELIDNNFVEAAFALSEGEILPVQVPILSLPDNGTVVQSTGTALLQAWQPWTSPTAGLMINGNIVEIPPEVRDTVYLRGPIQGSDSESIALSITPNGTITGVEFSPEGVVNFSKLPDASLTVFNATSPDTPRNFTCGADGEGPLRPPIKSSASIMYTNSTPATGASAILDAATRYKVIVAVETDYAFFQKFNNINTAANYVASTFNYINNIYVDETNLELGLGLVRLWNTNRDPYNDEPDLGVLLDEVRALWNSNSFLKAQPRNLVSYWTGISPFGGGIAWTGCNDRYTTCFASVLCGTYGTPYGLGGSSNYGYGVNGIVSPPEDNYNWQTIAHELGHNLGMVHSHSMEDSDGTCNPVDYCTVNFDACCRTAGNCPAASYPTCQTNVGNAVSISKPGTIMSYCPDWKVSPTLGRNFGTENVLCGKEPERMPDRISGYVSLIADNYAQCLTVISPQPPSAPTALTAGSIAQTSATFSWTASTTVGNPALSGYTVKCVRYLSGCYSSPISQITVGSGTLSARVSGLISSRRYTCYVTANSSGYSPTCSASGVNILTQSGPVKAGNPTNFRATAVARTAARFSWTPGTPGSPTETYTLKCVNRGQSCTARAVRQRTGLARSNSSEVTLNRLSRNTRYSCYVLAVTPGYSAPSCSGRVNIRTR